MTSFDKLPHTDADGYLCDSDGKRLEMKMTRSTALILRAMRWWRVFWRLP